MAMVLNKRDQHLKRLGRKWFGPSVAQQYPLCGIQAEVTELVYALCLEQLRPLYNSLTNS
jgi:hypothetical protein